MKTIELNEQQIEFIIDKLQEMIEQDNNSQFSITIMRSLLAKLQQL